MDNISSTQRIRALAAAAVFASSVAISGACDDARETEDATSTGTASGSSSSGGATCPALYAECDGDPGTVCETAIESDPLHCGSCDAPPCTVSGPHALPTCVEGTCAVTCEPPFEDCDGDPSNGCESITGCDVGTIVKDIDSAFGLAVDTDYVYYGTRGHREKMFEDGTVMRARLDGRGTPEVLATGQVRPLHLTIDATRVYWDTHGHASTPDGTVMSANKDGTHPCVIAKDQYGPAHVVVAGDTIYWLSNEAQNSVIRSAPSDTCDASAVPTDIVSGIFSGRDLEVANGVLYWVSDGQPPDFAPEVAQWTLATGVKKTLMTGIDEPSYQIGVGADALFVGSAAAHTVTRVPLVDGSAPTVLVTDAGSAQEIVHDAALGRIFFTTGIVGAIASVGEHGGAPSILVEHGIETTYLTQDATRLYWLDGNLDLPGAWIRTTLKQP